MLTDGEIKFAGSHVVSPLPYSENLNITLYVGSWAAAIETRVASARVRYCIVAVVLSSKMMILE